MDGACTPRERRRTKDVCLGEAKLWKNGKFVSALEESSLEARALRLWLQKLVVRQSTDEENTLEE